MFIHLGFTNYADSVLTSTRLKQTYKEGNLFGINDRYTTRYFTSSFCSALKFSVINIFLFRFDLSKKH